MKIIDYDVEIKSTRINRSYSTPEVYTNDLNSVVFQFKILDMTTEELTGATATTLLYMRDGSFFQNLAADVTLNGNVFSYTLKENEGNHSGTAQIQLIVKIGAKEYASQLFNFKIANGLGDKVVVEVMVQDWKTLTTEARSFIDEFEDVVANAKEQVNDNIVETAVAEKYENMEAQYASDLSTLKQYDVSLTAQLQQNASNVESIKNGFSSVGVIPVLPQNKLKVLAPLNGSVKNYAGSDGILTDNTSESLPINTLKILAPLDGNARNYMGADGTVAGTLTYENGLFYKGAKFDGTQMLTFPFSQETPMNAYTYSFRFRPLQKFDSSLNMDYRLLNVFDAVGNSSFRINLNYLDAQNYNGIEVLLGTKQVVSPNIVFEQGKTYSITVVWSVDDATGKGFLSTYVNGAPARSPVPIVSADIPVALPVELRVGNQSSLNRPAMGTIEAVFVMGDAINIENVLELYKKPLKLEAVNDSTTYRPIDVLSQDLFFYQGEKFDGQKLLSFPITPNPGKVNSGTIFARFKPLQTFDSSLNMDYRIIHLFDTDGAGALTLDFHYLDAQNYNGINLIVRNGANYTQAVIGNKTFNKDEIYSIGVTWDFKEEEGRGTVAIYINGLIEKAVYLSAAAVPKGIQEMRVGNQSALNRPAMCAFESVYYSEEKLETSGMLELHRKPLDLESVNNPTVYKPKYEAVGYKREVQDVIVLNYIEGTMFGVKRTEQWKLLKSDDEGESWQTHYDLNSTNVIIQLVEKHGNYLFIGVRDGVKNTLRRSLFNATDFVTVLNFNDGHAPIGGWNWDIHDGKIVVSEYGQSTGLARVFLSQDGGATFTVIKTLPPTSQHIHSSNFDPYTGYIWITWGDTIDATEYSPDLGQTWVVINNIGENQSTPMVFTQDAVIFASDSIAGGSHLRIYNKNTGEYKRLSNVTEKYLSHVYALDIDDRDYLWWFGNREAMPGVVNTIYISPDFGATPILLEDIGTELISSPYRFVKTKNDYYLGNSKITRPIIKRL